MYCTCSYSRFQSADKTHKISYSICYHYWQICNVCETFEGQTLPYQPESILLKIYQTAEKHYAQDRKCLLKLSNSHFMLMNFITKIAYIRITLCF